MNEFIKKQDNLYYRIMQRLNSEPITTDDEIVSYLDVANAIEKSMGTYNNALLERERKYLRLINKKNLKTKSFPKATKIISSVKEEYNRIDILFDDNKKIVLVSNFPGNYEIAYTDFDAEKSKEFINKDKTIYNYIFANLLSFKFYFPGFEYTFKNDRYLNKNKYSQVLDDGFISFSADMNGTKNRDPYFSNDNDSEVASQHSKKHGKLEDYLFQRRNEMLSKCYVNRSELNPLINTMVDNYIDDLDEDFSFNFII